MSAQSSESTNPAPANWSYTPSPGSNRFMSFMLRAPLLHRVLSGQMLIITFTGRKSGKTYSTPVGYRMVEGDVVFTTKTFRTWWRNFQEPAPVTLRLRGRDVTGSALAHIGVGAVTPHLMQFLAHNPMTARVYGVTLGDDGQPNPADVARIADKLAVVVVTLDQ